MYAEEIFKKIILQIDKDKGTKKEVIFIYFTWTGKMKIPVDCDVYV